jgi:hypothetical protein
MCARPLLACAALLAVAGLAPAQYGELKGLKILKKEDAEHVKSVPAPKGAVVLFGGKNLDGWVYKDKGKDNKVRKAAWKLLDDGIMQVQGGDIHTEKTFEGKFKLHVEFRVPYEPKNKDQGRGNSGVYLQGRYEVQILDSYGIKNLGMGDCGSIYGVSIAKSNVCKAPTIWQSYDIEFTSPKCKEGKIVEAGRMTVTFNGVKIHDDVPLKRKNKDGKDEFVTNTTSGMGGDPCKPGPIMLQDHGHPVQFRNVWLVQLKDEK